MSKLKAKEPGTVVASKAKGLIFGASGVGKTWFTLTFPKPYYIDTEGGAGLEHYQERLKAAGGAYMGPSDGSLDFDTILEQMKALATEKHEYKTLVIDSITKAFQTSIANASERLGEKDAFGASKKPAVSKMRQLINWAMKLDMNIWFVAHEVAEWGVVDGQRCEIGKIPDVWDKLVYELDLTLRVIRPGKIYPSSAIIHKTRLLGFPLGEAFSLDYPNFSKRYGKDFLESDTKPIVLATHEVATEIKRLVSLLKISEEDCDKLLTKAGANDWEELSQDQAAKAIAWLNSKMSGGK